MSANDARMASDSQFTVARDSSTDTGLIPRELFMRLLHLERKRTERSGRRFILMLLDTGNLLETSKPSVLKLVASLNRATRDTDLKGWYRTHAVIGVIFTEIGSDDDKQIVQTLSNRVIDSMYDMLSIPEMNQIRLSFHVFPEDWDGSEFGEPIKATLNPPVTNRKSLVEVGAKRALDIVGSILLLTALAPVLLVVAVAVKLTSKGPVLFRQVRLGQHGKRFTFLKFRSMYDKSDQKVHEDYVKRFILGSAAMEQDEAGQKLYKLTRDPRITPLGRFLRTFSLDELPQFLNVLSGEMSLVGPRPPLVYEFERYNLWHRQRLSVVKPGITGLWQVHGRSRVKFDEMVRLDIRYARTWSIWLDIKILLQTPRTVISGSGAA